jgi:hypothetical protein
MALGRNLIIIASPIFLSLVIGRPAKLLAQPAPQNSWEHQARGLQILVLEGSRAESYPGSLGISPVVEVRDDVDRPVEGALVTFDLPQTGPGGTFQGGDRSFTAKTNAQGQAMPPRFTMGSTLGPFYIRVSAKYRDLRAQTSILQAAAVRPRPTEAILRPRHTARKWVILGVIGGAGGGGLAYALTRGTSHPIKISIGGSVFTQP